MITLQLNPTPTSSEPQSATGQVRVDLETGQLTLQLESATPLAVYTAVFLSASSTLQIGVLSTGAEGNGNLETTLSAGTYVGHFELIRLGITQLASSEATFAIAGTSATSSETITNQTTSTSELSTTSQTNPTQTGQIIFQVEPAFVSVNSGGYAKVNIRVVSPSLAADVLLVARNVPDRSVAIFSPNVGRANPEFQSTLTIVTSSDTQTGTYGVTVTAIVNGRELDSQLTVQVNSLATLTQSTTFTISPSSFLTISIESDRRLYSVNSTAVLLGHVTDNSGNAASETKVAVQVDDPTGTEIAYLTDIKTDAAGIFRVNIRIPPNATLGTYVAFATASKVGYLSATTHISFVVGSTTTPSVVIAEVYATDTSGTRSAVFSAGQTVLVWVVVENVGTPFQGVIWVQIRDPNGAPVSIQLQISTLNTGETVKIAFGFQILAGSNIGLYTASALVSDKLISQGGTFLASTDTQFAVTG